MNFLFFGLILAAGIGLVFWGWYAAEKRAQLLKAWALAHGLLFSRAKQYGFDNQHRSFSGLEQGDNRYAWNIATGQWQNRAVTTFDYHYQTYSTDSKGRRRTNHHYFSGVLLACPVPFRPLVIRRENIFDKIGAAFGWDDIDFESAEFSRKFCVKSSDKRWAYDVLHQRTMEFLLQQDPAGTIEFGASEALLATPGTCSPLELEFALGVVGGIFERLPDYVLQQQQAKASV